MKKARMTPNQIMAIGFAVMVLGGGVLLSLPISSRSGEGTPFLNALFISTSCSCVTGLTVYDPWTQFSFFGQVVMLLLIQFGGLGFMSAMAAIIFLTKRRAGLRERALLADTLGTGQLSGTMDFVRLILLGTLIVEGIGALILSTRMIPAFGLARGIWFSVFHSVSAFCNAGFDLFGILDPGKSLECFQSDPVVLITIALLILVGGIGFIVWSDVAERHRTGSRLRFHSRIVIWGTVILTAVGTILFLLTEWDASMADMSYGDKLLNAFFQSVTPRTAGFAAFPMSRLSHNGKGLTILYMIIGAAPGGTGGGLKVSTAVVIAASTVSFIRSRSDINLFGSRLDDETVWRSHVILILFLALIGGGVFILCGGGTELSDAVFECVSAIATVGLTTGITTGLNSVSKIVLILLMYTGRVGGITVFFAMNVNSKREKLRNAIGKVYVG